MQKNETFSRNSNLYFFLLVILATSHITESFFETFGLSLRILEIVYFFTLAFILVTRPKVQFYLPLIYYFCLMLLFVFWAFISTTYTVDEANYKFKLLQTFSSILFIPLLLFVSPTELKRFFIYIHVYCITAISIFFFLFFVFENLIMFSDHIIWLTLLRIPLPLSELLLVSTLYLVMTEKTNIAILALLVSAISMVYMGTRGSFLFLLLCASLFYLISVFNKKIILSLDIRLLKKSIGLLAILLLPAIVLWTFNSEHYFFTNNISRHFLAITKFSEDVSIQNRLTAYLITIDFIDQRPFLGHGLNSFSVLTQQVLTLSHPHNVFLEILLETGLVGFIPFIAAILALGYYQIKYLPSAVMAFALYLTISKSSSFSELRIFHFMLGLTFLVCLAESLKCKNLSKSDKQS